jgi:hypothetical protein
MAIRQKNNSLPFFRIGSTPRQKIYLGTNLVYSIEPLIPFSGILDDYPTAAGAWSVARRLSSTYTGNILTVRRASDNTTQNISYTPSGDLDTASIASFCSGTTGHVTTLFDQSGNGVNLSQATTTKQPIIYETGAVVTRGPNSEPSLYFDGVNDILVGNYPASTNSLMSVFSVDSPFDLTGGYVPYAQMSGLNATPAFGILSTSGGTFIDFMWAAGQEAVYSPNTANLAVRTAIRRSASPQNRVYLNGVAGGTTTSITDVTIGTVVSIGGIFPDSHQFPYKGWISEVIVWRADQTSNVSGIDGNMGTYYGV